MASPVATPAAAAAAAHATPAAPPLLLLSESAVRDLLPMREAIHVNRQAFLAAALTTLQQAQVPPYASISASAAPGEAASSTLFKPALLEDALGVKVVAVRPANEQRGLPTVPAVILLSDRLTGFPISMLQATYLTALRTAAGSGVATDVFASPDARVLAVFGAGMQAEAHVEAVLAVRPLIHTVHIINRSTGRAEELVAALRTLHPQVTFAVHATSRTDAVSSASLQSAVLSAHVICTTTSSTSPLLHLADVSPGVHINAVGSFLPSMCELAPDLVGAAHTRIAVDGPAACHAGDLHAPLAEGRVREEQLIELGACIPREEATLKPTTSRAEEHGHIQVGFNIQGDGTPAKQLRQSSDDITIFKSVGSAIQDVATAYAVLQKARAQGRGKAAQWD